MRDDLGAVVDPELAARRPLATCEEPDWSESALDAVPACSSDGPGFDRGEIGDRTGRDHAELVLGDGQHTRQVTRADARASCRSCCWARLWVSSPCRLSIRCWSEAITVWATAVTASAPTTRATPSARSTVAWRSRGTRRQAARSTTSSRGRRGLGLSGWADSASALRSAAPGEVMLAASVMRLLPPRDVRRHATSRWRRGDCAPLRPGSASGRPGSGP